MQSQRLPWSENVYEPDFGYRIQPQDPDNEIQRFVDAMKHMEQVNYCSKNASNVHFPFQRLNRCYLFSFQPNLVGDQLTSFLSGPAFNGRQPFVSLGDTTSDSGDDEISANMIAVQCQSVEALLYEENASFP